MAEVRGVEEVVVAEVVEVVVRGVEEVVEVVEARAKS